VDPPATTVHACEEFTVDIRVQDVVDLYAWEIFMSFNPAAAECVDVAYGPFLSEPKLSIPPIIRNDLGYVAAGETRLGIQPGVSGSGILATITFHCLSPIDTDLLLYNDFLYDPNWNLIPHDIDNGHVTQLYWIQHQITVTATPAGAIGGTFDVTYTKCGVVYALTGQTTTWSDLADAGTTVTVSSPQSPISGGVGTQYVFEDYNPSAMVTMNAPKTITLEYKTQYEVKFTQTGSAVAPTVTYTADTDPTGTVPFEVWVKAGSQISYTYPAIVPGVLGVQYVLTGVNPASPQTVNSPLTILGTYKTQYYLTVVTFPQGLAPPPTPPSGWYDACTYVTLTASPTAHDTIVYTFQGWRINGQWHIGENPITIHMDSPKIAVAWYCGIGDPIGDVNLDGKVDMLDIAMIAKYYGAKIGDPNYSIPCDINGDGKIDLRDLATAARNLGR